MWRWDQGHLPYFQFDTIRRISKLVVSANFKSYDREKLLDYSGLDFRAPGNTHSPWRNYARVLKLCLLAYEDNNIAVSTRLAQLLSQPGIVTCDEYFHFFVRAFTDNSPAFTDWAPITNPRYPLLFSLKYILSKHIVSGLPTSLSEAIGAYIVSRYTGDETDEEFIRISRPNNNYANSLNGTQSNIVRQAKESIRVISQISYLTIIGSSVLVSLDKDDAHDIFASLNPIGGPFAKTKDDEIIRLSSLYASAASDVNLEYKNTSLDETVNSGFVEGGKVEKTHIIIERNKNLIIKFFKLNPTTICDLCKNDTKHMYPWTERVIDLHHTLPLSSGTRAEARGTSLTDLVPVCPSCHRAVHRFYHNWLSIKNKKDFDDKTESLMVYESIRSHINTLQL